MKEEKHLNPQELIAELSTLYQQLEKMKRAELSGEARLKINQRIREILDMLLKEGSESI